MRPLRDRCRRSSVLLLCAPILLAGAGKAAARPQPARSAPTTWSTPGISFHDGHGIHVLKTTQLGGRQYNARIDTKALGRAVDVRFLLPAHYGSHPSRRYPVLYLFHGTSGRASDWVKSGGARQTTAGRPLITVMPDAGFNGNGGGWFTNWVDSHTALGPSRWETFDIHQLIPWVDANLRTVAHRHGRAIAGLSQGGFGAMSYAARHPDLFVAAASFSGAPEIDRDPDVITGATAVIDATAVFLDGVEPDAMFGDRATHEINWRGHDPSTLMTNLRGMGLFLWTATGLNGKYDHGLNPGGSAIEAMTHVSTVDFHKRLIAARIPSHYDDYKYGTHTFPYWARDLRQFIGPLMKTFARPPSRRRVRSYKSVNPHWAQWGWRVSLHRAVRQQFSALSRARSRGFSFSGTGVAHVTTPAFYRPGSQIRVRLRGNGLDRHIRRKVRRSGRLRLRLPLSSSSRPGAVRVTIHPGSR